jgi:AcrR family transcriptional regulator
LLIGHGTNVNNDNISVKANVMLVNMPAPSEPNASPNQPLAASGKESYHHGDLKRALIAAATVLIETGGSKALTLRAAATAAGVSIAAPYRHFPDRDALLAAVLTQAFDDLAATTETARQACADPLQALKASGLAYVRFAVARPHIYRLMFGPECHKAAYPALAKSGMAAFDVLRRAVAACQTQGLVRGTDPQTTALAGWALSHGLASLCTDGLLNKPDTPTDMEGMASILIDMLIHGVQAPAEGK